MHFDVLVEVQLLPGISDPQGQTIERSLPLLGFPEVTQVRAGKAIRLSIDAASEEAARAKVDDLCQRFLINPVIEAATVTMAATVQAPR